MRQILKKKEFHLDTYGHTVTLYFQKESSVKDIAIKVGNKISEVKDELEGEWKSEPGALAVCPPKAPRTYVFITDDITHGMIAHEVIHVVTDIFNKSTIDHNDHTDEVYAYLFQHILEKFTSYILTTLKIPTKSFLGL